MTPTGTKRRCRPVGPDRCLACGEAIGRSVPEQIRDAQARPRELTLDGTPQRPPVELVEQETASVAVSLPDTRVVVLEGQQHIAIGTAPELFAERVLGFLQHRD